MKQEDLIEALAIIAEEQQTEPGSVEIRIGQRRENDGNLYLISCSSAIIDAVTDSGFYVEATRFDGVRVFKADDEL